VRGTGGRRTTGAPSGSALVEVQGASFGYDRTPVLSDVTLAVQPQAFIGIVGPSGSGKTSLLRILLGTARPQRGTVARRPALTVAYVPQLETVDWSFPVTVGECVLMSRSPQRALPWATAAEKSEVAEVLERLGIGDLTRRHIRELSGGQQQRMFLARALLRRPQLLLLDEPTSGVDVGTRHEVLHLLDDLNRDGLAIVLTTHDLNGMAAHLPSLVALHGRVIAAGPPSAVIVPEVLERTFGARMEVLQHLGMPVVVDGSDRTALRTVGAG
jgi:ABC-type Mn2+/Zn2+ transport system ATPase subunit